MEDITEELEILINDGRSGPIPVPHAPVHQFIEMECPHNFGAGGAWYSEDYIRQLRELSHRLIALYEHGGKELEVFGIHIEELRELTR